MRSQKALPKPIALDIEHLHACLTAQKNNFTTDITLEELTRFISSKGLKNEPVIIEGQIFENLLREFLLSKAEGQQKEGEGMREREGEIEEIIRNVEKSYHLTAPVAVQEATARSQIETHDPLELELKPYNEYIDDVVKWKGSMKLGPAPLPVLSISKLMGKL